MNTSKKGVETYDPRSAQEFLYQIGIDENWSSFDNNSLAICFLGKHLTYHLSFIEGLLTSFCGDMVIAQVAPFFKRHEWSKQLLDGVDFSNIGPKRAFRGVGSYSQSNVHAFSSALCDSKGREDWLLTSFRQEHESDVLALVEDNADEFGPWLFVKNWKLFDFFIHIHLERHIGYVFYKDQSRFDELIKYVKKYR